MIPFIARAMRSLLQLAVLSLFAGLTFAGEAPPAAQVVGMTRPVPQGFAVHPGKRMLATLHDKGVHLTDLPTLTIKRQFSMDAARSSAVTFSADGTLIAIGHDDGVVSIWRMDGRRVNWVKGHLDRVAALAFSQDGRWLATGGFDGTTQVWSTSTWSRAATLDGVARVVIDGEVRAVLGLQFSHDSRFLYSLETANNGHVPHARTLSAWHVGSWIEAGRLRHGLKEDMNISGLDSNPLAAPLAVSGWGRGQLFAAAEDGYGRRVNYGSPKSIVPPSVNKLRAIAAGECFPDIGDPDDLFPSDTWLTALAAESTRGWLAAAYLTGRNPFSPGLALIPLGTQTPPRYWPTSRQSLLLAFDGGERLYSLTTEGQVIAWEIGPLQPQDAAINRKELLADSCRPLGESPAAQQGALAKRKVLERVAEWTINPDLKNTLLQWYGFDQRFDLAGERLVLWGPRGRIVVSAITGEEIERDRPLANDEKLVPSRTDSPQFIVRPDTLLMVDPASGKRQVVAQKSSWYLKNASIAGDYLTTAWVQRPDRSPEPVTFQVQTIQGKIMRELPAPPVREAAVPKNLSPAPGQTPLSLLLSPDGRWLGYELLGDARFETWMLLDTHTGKSQRLNRPMQAITGTKILTRDARWMGLATTSLVTGMVETRMRRHISRLPADDKDHPHAQTYLAGAMSAKGNFVVSAAHDGSLKLWDAAGAEIASNQGAAAGVLAIGYDRTDENRLFSLHWDGTFILWEAREPSL